MTYRALYRVWRPQQFADLVGQQHVTRTLQNALKEGRLSHAYLFSGPRGTGKTSAAKIMAKAVNCEHGPAPEPCNACSLCERITESAVLDVVEIDAASNRGIEEIRDLRDKVKYAPTEVRKKVYIIDEVHMLTPEAFNALLKTLEEPPEHVLFILATTEPHKLPTTIVSRCQQFEFHRVSATHIVERLTAICKAENIRVEPEALRLIAQLSEGGLRDAIGLLDQVHAFGSETISADDVRAMVGMVGNTFFDQMLSFVKERNRSALLEGIAQFIQEGYDPEKCIVDLLHYLRDILLVKTAPTLSQTKERLQLHPTLKQVAEQFTEAEIFAMMEEVTETQQKLKWGSRPRILLELLFVKLTTVLSDDEDTVQLHGNERLLERIDQLEKQVQRLLEQPERTVVEREQQASPSSRPVSRRQKRQSREALQKVEAVRRQNDVHAFTEIKNQWAHILAEVKARKITVHAWLVDGEPVAVGDGKIVLAFKNFIHRETTDKPSHKQLIEEVIERVSGTRYEIVTCMQTEWGQLEASDGLNEQAAAQENDDEAHVRQALELFGEALVQIED